LAGWGAHVAERLALGLDCSAHARAVVSHKREAPCERGRGRVRSTAARGGPAQSSAKCGANQASKRSLSCRPKSPSMRWEVGCAEKQYDTYATLRAHLSRVCKNTRTKNKYQKQNGLLATTPESPTRPWRRGCGRELHEALFGDVQQRLVRERCRNLLVWADQRPAAAHAPGRFLRTG